MLELCAAERIGHEACDLSLAEVYRADEMFCTGTMGELAPVTKVDGRVIGSGETGPTTATLRDRFRALTAREGYPIVD